MVLVDLLVTDGVSLSRPLLALARELGVGVGVGAVGRRCCFRGAGPPEESHAYTAFLAAMLLVYGIASHLDGSGAMAVLTAALLLGNASITRAPAHPRRRRAGVRNQPKHYASCRTR